MKKLISLSVLLALMLSVFSACREKAPEPPKKVLTPHIESLPDIGSYTPDKAPVRFYENYTDTVIPRDDYGTLIPYAGCAVDYAPSDSDFSYGGNLTMLKYGLMTEDEKIVTDPVYSNIQYFDSGYYLLEKSSSDPNEIHAFYRGAEYTLITYDGSEAVEFDGKYSYFYQLSDSLFLGQRFPTEEDPDSDSEFYVLDTKGKILASFDRDVNVTSNKSGVITVGRYDDTTDEYRVSFLDENYEIEDKSYLDFECVGDKYYSVLDRITGLIGVIDRSGKYVLPPEYSSFNISADGKSCLGIKDTCVMLISSDTLDEIPVYDTSNSDYSIFSADFISDKVICLYTSEDKNIYISTDHRKIDCDRLTFDGNFYALQNQNKKKTEFLDKDLKNVMTRPGLYEPYFFYPYDDAQSFGYSVFNDELGNYIVYNVNEGKIIYEEKNRDIYFSGAYKNLFITVDTSNAIMDSPEWTAVSTVYSKDTGDVLLTVCDNFNGLYNTKSKNGDMLFYQKGGYLYTADENLNTIFRIRTEKD